MGLIQGLLTLVQSLFSYCSPSDDDGYSRPIVEYSINDQQNLQAGASVLNGEQNHTFFGQMKGNTDTFLAVL